MTRVVLKGDISVNCYLIEKNGFCYVVDPGYEKQRLREIVASKNLTVLGILLTHGHVDHIGALDAFDVPVYLHESEKEILLDDVKNGFSYYKMSKPYNIDALNLVTITATTKLKLEDEEISVIHTPGHTIGCVCYKHGNYLYSGDTLFRGTVGRCDFPTGDEDALRNSIKYLLENLPEETLVYPGHGISTKIKTEKENNPFYVNN